MNEPRAHGRWLIALSIVLALVLMITPLPGLLQPYRPEWTMLVIIYWSLALPARVGVGIAWLVGLLQDVLQATPLGSHALAFALAAYLTIQLYQRIRNFPLWQQALTVLLLMLLVRGALFATRGLMDSPALDWRFWLPVLTSTLVWPPLFLLLRFLRRTYRVN